MPCLALKRLAKKCMALQLQCSTTAPPLPQLRHCATGAHLAGSSLCGGRSAGVPWGTACVPAQPAAWTPRTAPPGGAPARRGGQVAQGMWGGSCACMCGRSAKGQLPASSCDLLGSTEAISCLRPAERYRGRPAKQPARAQQPVTPIPHLLGCTGDVCDCDAVPKGRVSPNALDGWVNLQPVAAAWVARGVRLGGGQSDWLCAPLVGLLPLNEARTFASICGPL